MDAATIRIAIETDGSGAARGFNVALASANTFQTQMTRTLARVKSSFDQLSTGTKALGLLGIGLGALGLAFAAVAGPAIEFESAFAGVLKTVDGTPGQLASIRTGLLDLSSVMPTTATELAGIAENAGQLGVAAGDVLEFTEVVAQLGETTDLDFDQAAQSLARFQNITGNDASIRQLGDVIVELGNNSATTESQIVTFASRLASGLTVAGAREDEILALASSFSSLGLEAEAGASALTRVVTEITDAAVLGGPELRVFAETAGLLPDEFARIAQESPVEALVLFGEGLGRVSEEGRSITPILEQLDLAGIRTSRTLQLLALGSDLVRDQLGLAATQFDEGGAAAEEYGKRVETTASRLEILQNRLQRIAIDLGTPALDTFAAGADLAGDAIARLAELLTPLAEQLSIFFGNAAVAAGDFYDVIGSPALGVAVASLNGVLVALTGLVGVLNSLGPAGAVLTGLLATLALYPSVVVAARTAVAGLALSYQLAGASGAAAAAGATAFQAALAVGPLIAFTATLALVGKAFLDADRAAQESAASFQEALDVALDTGSVQAVVDGLDAIIARQDELRSVTADQEANVGTWERFGRAIQGTAQILTPFTENTVRNAQQEIAALNDVLADSQLGNFESSVGAAARNLDLTSESVIRVASELGVLEDLTQGTTEQFFQAQAAIEAATIASRSFGDEAGILSDKLIQGTATTEEIARALGITRDELAALASLSNEFDFDDLLDPESQAEAAIAAERLNAAYGELGAILGESGGEFAAQLESVNQLAAAHNELEAAISGVTSAMGTLGDSQERLTEAQNAYNDQLAAFQASGSEADYRALADAALDLSLAQSAIADSGTAALASNSALIDSFIEAGQAAGLSQEEIAIWGATITGLPEEYILLVQQEGAEAAAEELAILEASRERLGIAQEMRITADTLDAEAAIGLVAGAVGSLVAEPYSAELTANPDPALESTGTVVLSAESFANGTYEAELLAQTATAEERIAAAESSGRSFADAEYEAQITADSSDAESKTAASAAAGIAFAREYRATLTADDQASAVIRGAIGVLSGFVSRTVTLTTNRVTNVVTNLVSANGSVTAPSSSSGGGSAGGGGSTTFFADGGIPLGLPSGARREQPGRAQVYQATTFGRYFAEPETGGEAYIPLASSKRGRSIQIWQETGRLLGVLADGGIQRFGEGGFSPGGGTAVVSPASTVFAPSLQISITASAGMDETQLGRVVEQRVSQALSRQAQQLNNRRF